MKQTKQKTRRTPQMLEILKYLKKNRTHPTAEKIYKHIKRKIPTITLATTYRNLHKLKEMKEILSFEINGEMRYDGYTHSHMHFICTECKKIYDFPEEKAIKYIKRKTKEKGYFPEEVTIIIKGKCKKCLAKKGKTKQQTKKAQQN